MPLKPIPPSPKSLKDQLNSAEAKLQADEKRLEARRNDIEEKIKKAYEGHTQTGTRGVPARDEIDALRKLLEKHEAEQKSVNSELRDLRKKIERVKKDIARVDEIINPAD